MQPPEHPPGPGVDLNADLGEEVGHDASRLDADLLSVVTSANVACGYHAGSPATMRAVCARAAELGVGVGAHVSYADRPRFGRAPVDVAPAVLREQVADQVGVLADVAAAAGTTVRHLKPHGALYHRVLHDQEQAHAVLDGSVLDGSVLDRSGGPGLPVLGMPGRLLELAARAGRPAWLEGFPDRGYDDDGRLLPRDRPGAVLDDDAAIAAQAVALAPRVASLCVHGDTPGAVDRARAVRAALEAVGYVLRTP